MTADVLSSLSPGRRRTIQRVIDADGFMGADHFAGVTYRVLGRGRARTLEWYSCVPQGQNYEPPAGSAIVDSREFVAPSATGAVVVYDRRIHIDHPTDEWRERYAAHARPHQAGRPWSSEPSGSTPPPGPFSFERQLVDAGMLEAPWGSLWSFAALVVEGAEAREIVGACQAQTLEHATAQAAEAITSFSGGLPASEIDLVDTQMHHATVTWPVYERTISGDPGDWSKLLGL